MVERHAVTWIEHDLGVQGQLLRRFGGRPRFAAGYCGRAVLNGETERARLHADDDGGRVGMLGHVASRGEYGLRHHQAVPRSDGGIDRAEYNPRHVDGPGGGIGRRGATLREDAGRNQAEQCEGNDRGTNIDGAWHSLSVRRSVRPPHDARRLPVVRCGTPARSALVGPAAFACPPCRPDAVAGSRGPRPVTATRRSHADHRAPPGWKTHDAGEPYFGGNRGRAR